MRRVLIFTALLLSTTPVMAQAVPVITQSDLNCVSPAAFIKVNANVLVPPGEAIDYVRVYFRTPMEDADVWFFIDAVPEGSLWSAILPAPVPAATLVSYRSEVLLRNGATASTEIETVEVREGCELAAMDGNLCAEASLIIGTTASEPRMPEGFQSAGIDGVVTEDETLVAASTLTGWDVDSIVCPPVGGPAAVGGPIGGTILGLPAAGAVVGGLIGAGILGAIIDHQNRDQDVSPN